MFAQGWRLRRDAARSRAAKYEAERNDPRKQITSAVRAEHRAHQQFKDIVSTAMSRRDQLVAELVNLKAFAAKMDADALRTGLIDDRAQATEFKISKMPAVITKAEAEIKAAKANLAAFEKASAERLAGIEQKMKALDEAE